ncbi:MAG: MBL fold metallo-hydrolase [Pseudomonadota bacterium]|nr:MBL fold metallo-hydrolase [Pseudomonadota bacterium]
MHLLKQLFMAIGVSALLAFSSAGHAAAPLQKIQAPGYYRMMIGNYELTALSDGTVELPMEKLLSGIKIEQLRAILARNYRRPPVETSVNGFLLNTGSKLVLIDAGAGNLFGPTLGNLVKNLKASGYQPEQVDEVWLTHMHPDHIGGITTPDGKMVFPNAIIRADKGEGDYWLSSEKLNTAKPDEKAFFKGAISSLKPYIEAGKYMPFDGETELLPGVRSLRAPGHTPGHTLYQIENSDYKLVVCGDLIHVAAVQFPLPAVTISFDTDPRRAASERQKFITEAANRGFFLALAHVQFPGIGQVKAAGVGFEWVPANYYAIP